MDASLRYRVTFKVLYAKKSPSREAYDVCTWHGAEKVVVLATLKHRAATKGHILSARVEPLPDLPGRNCAPSDLVDRMEW